MFFYIHIVNNDKDALKISFFKRRSIVIRGTYFFLTIILILRLFKLQYIDYILYRKKANNNYLRVEFLLPKRGIIYDRNGKKITDNILETKLVIYINKSIDYKTINKTINLLKRPNITYNNIIVRIEKQIKNSIDKKFIIAKHLTDAEIARIKFNLIYLYNVNIEYYYRRNYKYNFATSPIIGYVMSIRNTNSNIAKLNLDYRVGKNGIEQIFENTLGGQIGTKYNVINVKGQIVNNILINKEIDGKDIRTTINQKLQNRLYDLLKGRNGAATLLDVNTGEILAMCSLPNIDPNMLSLGVSQEEWQNYVLNKGEYQSVFLNKNLSSAFPPGSTFKIISSLVALYNGWDVNKKYNCTGKHKIGNRIFHCWKAKDGGHGLVDFNSALRQSCNCYFYNISQYIKCNNIYDMAVKMGLGQKFMYSFKDEIEGIIPNAQWKKNKYNEIWLPGDNANFVIGQGYTSVTPIQLAIMIARLATNKEILPKYLLSDNNNYTYRNLELDEEILNKVRNALVKYNMPKGYQICGKTGSSQVISQRIDLKDMQSGKVKKETHSHALFVGYAPFDNPKYAVSIVVEHGMMGSIGAAPIGIQILKEAVESE